MVTFIRDIRQIVFSIARVTVTVIGATSDLK